MVNSPSVDYLHETYAEIKHTFIDGESVIEGYDQDGNTRGRYVVKIENGKEIRIGDYSIILFFRDE